MTMEKLLVFDVWGDYGHFRKFYTTSSPLTFSIPPRTSLCGLLGSVVGLGKEEYLNHFSKKDAQIALRLLNPVKKTRLGINLINTKGNHWTLVKKGGHEPKTEINSVVPLSGLVERRDSINFETINETKKKYFKEKLPMEMTPERIVTEYGEVMYEADGKPLIVIPKKFWELDNGERIIFL